ncbi:MAG TPA: radical SAM protein [Bacteroidales bacterium]|jgi:wyosine [tRNA(Phe)-imidazoG37] synthetase (radical SAM superfamily)|nr:radical SAM protein [Bacteroidota bacterium]HJN05506.1 radical SAM protein [Bacteroidales bacterium]|tara:strand:- start:705 stop:1484 length:780 start_codon:yes stop_codon:yes gene_type:complete
MAGFLFDNLIFGPVYSRRLGVSLGINLLPVNNKFCNFNCVYCECGWTDLSKGVKIVLPKRENFKAQLENKLKELQGTVNEPDSITFAGNGEPTIHPDFAEIINDTIEVRNRYAPEAAISILSNGSMLHKSSVKEALKRVDKNILKLDTGIESTFHTINQASGGLTLDKVINNLVAFDGKLIIQTLFVRGEYNGKVIDNTTDKEIEAWLKVLDKINPEYIMIYPIERGTAAKDIEKIPEEELIAIAEKVEALGISTKVYF